MNIGFNRLASIYTSVIVYAIVSVLFLIRIPFYFKVFLEHFLEHSTTLHFQMQHFPSSSTCSLFICGRAFLGLPSKQLQLALVCQSQLVLVSLSPPGVGPYLLLWPSSLCLGWDFSLCRHAHWFGGIFPCVLFDHFVSLLTFGGVHQKVAPTACWPRVLKDSARCYHESCL